MLIKSKSWPHIIFEYLLKLHDMFTHLKDIYVMWTMSPASL